MGFGFCKRYHKVKRFIDVLRHVVLFCKNTKREHPSKNNKWSYISKHPHSKSQTALHESDHFFLHFFFLFNAGLSLVTSCMSVALVCICISGAVCSAKLWFTPPLHTSHQIRGLEERSRSYQPAVHSCCFDTGGAPPCLSIIILSPLLHLQTSSNPPHTHTSLPPLTLPILPQLRGILQLWTMFHFFTGHIFDSLMAPTKRRPCTESHGAFESYPPYSSHSSQSFITVVWACLSQWNNVQQHFLFVEGVCWLSFHPSVDCSADSGCTFHRLKLGTQGQRPKREQLWALSSSEWKRF